MCVGLSVSVEHYIHRFPGLSPREPGSSDTPAALNSEYPKLGFQIVFSTKGSQGSLEERLIGDATVVPPPFLLSLFHLSPFPPFP